MVVNRPPVHEQRESSTMPAEEPVRRGALRAVLRIAGIAEATVGALLVVLILAMVIVQVAVRFLPVDGWVWTGEIAKFALGWLAFALAGYLLQHDQHISLDVIDHLLPERGRRVVRRLSQTVVALVCLAYVREGIELVGSLGATKSPAAGIPMSVVYVLPLAGFTLALVRAVCGMLLRREPR